MSDESKAGDKPEGRRNAGNAPPPPATADAIELKGPRDWALATGNGPKRTPGTEWSGNAVTLGMSAPRGSAEHEAASVLHGWVEHAHNEGKPIQLSREDYLAALKATHPEDEYALETEGPKKGEPKRDQWGNPVIAKHAGNPVPHPAALSKHKGAGVRVSLVNGQLTETKA